MSNYERKWLEVTFKHHQVYLLLQEQRMGRYVGHIEHPVKMSVGQVKVSLNVLYDLQTRHVMYHFKGNAGYDGLGD